MLFLIDMQPKKQIFHVLACPVARRAIRKNDVRVMWCLRHLVSFFATGAKYSDKRQQGFQVKSPGLVIGLQENTDPFKSKFSDFSITTMRSQLYNDEVVLLISTYQKQPTHAEFDLALKRCKPL